MGFIMLLAMVSAFVLIAVFIHRADRRGASSVGGPIDPASSRVSHAPRTPVGSPSSRPSGREPTLSAALGEGRKLQDALDRGRTTPPRPTSNVRDPSNPRKREDGGSSRRVEVAAAQTRIDLHDAAGDAVKRRVPFAVRPLAATDEERRSIPLAAPRPKADPERSVDSAEQMRSRLAATLRRPREDETIAVGAASTSAPSTSPALGTAPPFIDPPIAATIGRPSAPYRIAFETIRHDAATPATSPPARPISPWSRHFDGLTWLGVGEAVELRVGDGVLVLADPLAWFDEVVAFGQAVEPAAINTTLDVGRVAAGKGELSYWPRYAELKPAQRRAYLDWLSAGRVDVPPGVGYAFLFLYGLERRALAAAASPAEILAIFDEVLRLRRLMLAPDRLPSRSFDNYSGLFLTYLLARHADHIDDDRLVAWADSVGVAPGRRCDEECVAALLSWFARRGRPLPTWASLAVAGQLPKSVQSVVPRRVPDDFARLFARRFEAAHPGGMTLIASKRDRRFAYRPSSAALPAAHFNGVNPYGLLSQFDAVAELWNRCVDDLKRHSTLSIDEASVGGFSVERWEALPVELRDGVDHPMAATLAALVAECSGDADFASVSASVLATRLSVATDEGRLTPAQARRLAAICDDAGYAVEPDARLAGGGHAGDAALALYAKRPGDAPADAQRYAAASCMLRVGVALAGADGRVEPGELAVLSQQLHSMFELNAAESRRLDVARSLLADCDVAEAARSLRKLDASRRPLVVPLILAIVAADGAVSVQELKATRRLFAAIGLERDAADAALAPLMAGATSAADDEAPVVVAAAVAGRPGEAIPPPPMVDVKPTVTLDRAAIAAILRDTHEVARLLADAMDVARDEPGEERDAPATPTGATQRTSPPATAAPPVAVLHPSQLDQPAAPAGLPGRYVAFYERLLTRPTWSRAELAALAAESKLMASGAVEAVNEWSTDLHGGPLVYEDGDAFVLEQGYLN